MSGRTLQSDYRSSDRQGFFKSIHTLKDLRLENIFHRWADVSKLNYFGTLSEVSKEGEDARRKSLINAKSSLFLTRDKKIEERDELQCLTEEFPEHITSLMNEDNYWGCFYIFPGLYCDKYMPTVKVRSIDEVPDMTGGILTRDVVSVSLSYLHHVPILGKFAYIKLEVASMNLRNIDVLQHYKYLMYLDLSDNFLTDIKVLAQLPYLQYISVSHNRLNSVLEYDTPQWFLTEVHYKYNSVTKIRNLEEFWSITILDLSHNNIKTITGLDNLHYLRRLDLSFNHIEKLENLNHLRLIWLDVSNNNLSSFDYGQNSGLWTLLHLEYLNIEENKLASLKIFARCSRLSQLKARNNVFSGLLEMAVYMRQMRRLRILDLRGNPVSSAPGYKDVVINTFPSLLSLDEEDLEPIETRRSKMEMSPDVNTCSIRRLLRLLYVEQLSRARVPSSVPPADTSDVPIVVIVGYEAVGKGTLARRLAKECSGHIELARLHTTSPLHRDDMYHKISREQFDEMLLVGDFLTYSEIGGESYGLSRKEAVIKDGRVKLVCMDLLGALMLRHRGRRPCLILATYRDNTLMAQRQNLRKMNLQIEVENQHLAEDRADKSTLQVLVSGRIIMGGIVNEIIQTLPEGKYHSDFLIPSDCSLMKDSNTRQAANNYVKALTFLATANSHSTQSFGKISKHVTSCQNFKKMYSLYESGNPFRQTRQKRTSDLSRAKSVDFKTISGSKVHASDDELEENVHNTKYSKSETFVQSKPETSESEKSCNVKIEDKEAVEKSFSTRLPIYMKNRMIGTDSGQSIDEDLWLEFLLETGILQGSDTMLQQCSESDCSCEYNNNDDGSDNLLMAEECCYKSYSCETFTSNIRDNYENIHRLCPGLFRDTVSMDDSEEAYLKMKKIIKNIVKAQKYIPPMFDIEFTDDDPSYQDKLKSIKNKIAPYTLF